MLQRIRDARENEQGFTLIELLIVIVILGVLSAVVVFSVQAFNDDGKEAACMADAKNVEIAAEAYLAKTGAAPASIAVLKSSGYLKQEPPTEHYTITLTGTTVTASGACTITAPAPATP